MLNYLSFACFKHQKPFFKSYTTFKSFIQSSFHQVWWFPFSLIPLPNGKYRLVLESVSVKQLNICANYTFCNFLLHLHQSLHPSLIRFQKRLSVKRLQKGFFVCSLTFCVELWYYFLVNYFSGTCCCHYSNQLRLSDLVPLLWSSYFMVPLRAEMRQSRRCLLKWIRKFTSKLLRYESYIVRGLIKEDYFLALGLQRTNFSTVQTFSSCTGGLNICQCPVVQMPKGNMSTK